MKHIKRLLSMIVFVAVLVASMFTMTACNLIVTDVTAYYEQVVATFTFDNKTIEVKMSDLNDTFKNYGYSRYNQGYYSTMEECINDSLNYYIQKSMLCNHIAKTLQEVYEDTGNELYNFSFVDFENYNWDETLENIYTSTSPNALEIKYNAFNAMQENVDAFIEEILEEEGTLAEIETEENETLRDPKEEYESKLVVYDKDLYDSDGNWIGSEKQVKYNIEELNVFNNADVTEHFVVVNNYNADLTAKGYNRYVNVLQRTAKSEERSTTEKDVILFEEANNIKYEYQNKLLELYEYWYQTNQEVPTSKIIDYYKNQYEYQKDVYENNIDAYRTAMGKYTDGMVYYNVNSGEEYVIVNHILIKFSAEQEAKLSELKTKYESDKVTYANNEEVLVQLEENYNNDRMSIIVQTKSKYEVEGEQKEAYVGDIIEEISNYVSTNKINKNAIISESELLKQKAKNFEDLVYIYNDDTGNMNSDFYYAINVNEGVDSQYVTEFTNGGIDLYNNYEVGDVLAYPVISEYGIHIMFYSGVAENVVDASQNNAVILQELLTKTVNPASDKTIFEYIYDIVEAKADYYNQYVNSTINNVYNSSEIVTYEYKYNDLWG